MFLGAILVDSQVPNHFANVADFDVVKLWQVAKNSTIPSDDSTVSCSANFETRSALLQHPQNVG